MTHIAPAEDMSEIYDADIPRIDLVGKGANGTSFLLAKSADQPSMFDADQVRALIKEQENDQMKPAVVVAKADDIDLTVPLAEPESNPAPGTENNPGSEAWEAVDHASAEKWLSVLYRAHNALELLAEREDIELVAGQYDGDGMKAWNLEDAASAVWYAIGLLAVYSADEKAAVELSAELEAVGKALASDTAPLEVLERFAPVLKAGRVLSASNEAALRGAAEAIQKVLAALPAAPEETIEKESTVTEKNTTAAPVAPAEAPVEKAEAMQAIFDQDGKLVGAVKPSQIVPLDGGAAPADDAAPAEPTTTDLEAAPPAEVGTTDAPADEEPVEKSTEEAVEKSAADLLKEIQAKDEEHALVVKDLQETIEKLRAEPAPSKVLANGAVPPEHLLRGQADGSSAAVTNNAELRKKLEEAGTPAEQEEIRKEMNEQAIAALQTLRTGK